MLRKNINNIGKSSGWALFALALGGFGIGTGEFIMMGLLPDVARSLSIPEPQAGNAIAGYALGVLPMPWGPGLAVWRFHWGLAGFPPPGSALYWVLPVSLSMASLFDMPVKASRKISGFTGDLNESACAASAVARLSIMQEWRNIERY